MGMPRPKNRLDAILRDEAKNMMGRTPAQGWLKPERVSLSIRRITMRDLLDPYRVDQGKLVFVLDSPRTGFNPQALPVRPTPELLERFLELAAAPAPQIHEFASRFGALLIFC